jgi:serine/threonine-protein kinase
MTDWSRLGTDQTQAAFALDGPPSVDAAVSLVPGGEVVGGRYELLGLIGTGGMGRVYRARDRELDEIIALKVLHRDLLGSDQMVGRFRQEVKLARRVTHRNVARTFDIGEHQAERFLTMELIEGESLSAILARSGMLGVREALALALQVCAGMAAAHAAEVIHRDLKPDNVLVARDGRVVITDFGIARSHLPGAAGKTSGQAVGTPTYMAPEQVEARVDVDARADIYAFGALLYEALTGVRAWPGDAPYVVAMARLLHPPPDPRSLRADLPDEVAALVQRAMARDREARFSTADELAQAIVAASGGLVMPVATSTMPLRPLGAAKPKDKTVAVLAFRNIGPAEDAYLADGLTEDLLDTLSTVRGLRVRARGLGAPAGDPAEEGRRLGVDVVVEGSVRRLADGFRVTARLVGSHDGFQIWSSRFERSASAAFALNDEVARAIAAALSTGAELVERRMVTDPLAIDLYLRGRHELARHWMGDQSKAMALLTEARDRAPHDPTILAAYATARIRSAFLGNELPQGLDAIVQRAIESAPGQGEPWTALGALRWNVEDDAPGAIRAVKRALLVAPSLGEANDLAGRLLLEAGEIDEAMALLERALWLDPSIPFARIDLMRAAAFKRQWARVEEVFEAREDAEWQAQARISLLRYRLWRRDTTVPQEPLPAVADDRSTLYVRVLEDLFKTGSLSEHARRFLSEGVDRLPPRARGRRLLSQIATELHVYAEDDEGAQRYLALSVDAGLLDRSWIEHNPLLKRYRGQAWFEAARATIGERAARIVEAWRGAPEPLPNVAPTVP